jgi:4-alpha-glucanotransferase
MGLIMYFGWMMTAKFCSLPVQPEESGALSFSISRPGRSGMGDLGPEAYRFVDFLSETGQHIWQILPLGHTSYGNSPYMCLSAFGGNPFLISLERLVEEDLLDAADIADPPPFAKDRADYGRAIPYRIEALKKSFARFSRMYAEKLPDDYYEFCQSSAALRLHVFPAEKENAIHGRRIRPMERVVSRT